MKNVSKSSWECSTWFNNETSIYILSEEHIHSNFNSPWKCHNTLPSNTEQPKYVFKYTFRQHDDDDDKENNIIDNHNQNLDSLRLQPDFKYYQNHEFHKLGQSLTNNKTLSILHTNTGR